MKKITLKRRLIIRIPTLFLQGLLPLLFLASCGPSKPQNGQSLDPENNQIRFDFGSGRPSSGFLKVDHQTLYTENAAFGFLEQHELLAEKDYITSTEPFYFLADAAEGNYNIKITATGLEGGSLLTVKTESRRLVVKNLEIPSGETRSVQFTTNVRYPNLDSGGTVRLKSREYGHFNWDSCLSIEFNGLRPAISSVEISRNDTAITLFLAGNSTVTDQRHEPYSAWGQMLPRFFKPGYISVANHAESGEALKSFVGEKRLEKLMSQIRSGDYLFIQFGHNDSKKQSSAYAAPFEDYQDLLRKYISEAKKLGANPVLVTPLLRRSFDEYGKIINTHGDYPEAMRQVAAEENVGLIDLWAMSKILYETLGEEESKKVFLHYPIGSFPGQEKEIKDNSHQSNYGAYELASCVVEGIRANQPALAAYLMEDLPDFDPAQPDPFSSWDLPASPSINTVKPEGN